LATAEEVAGQAVRRLRVARGWSQEEIAERMKAYGYDWHQTLVGRIEAAQRPLRLNEAVHLAALFGVALETLLGQVGPDMEPDSLRRRIEISRQRVASAREDYEVIHAQWDELTKQLADLGQSDSHARGRMAAAEAELESLIRAVEQAEGQPFGSRS
jgi:transcriptional regulator with XRE-family HTH domain